MRPLLVALVALPVLASCTPATPEKPKEDKKPAAASSCGVTMDGINGTAWVQLKPQAQGPDKPAPVTRIRFRDDGGKTVADYTAGSLSEVYQYDCTRSGNLLSCAEHDTHYKEWCRAWASVHDGVCDPALLAPVIGAKAEDLAEASKLVNDEFKAAKGDARAQLMKDYNTPNNKVRGKIRVALNPGTCQLTIEDKFQAMYQGRVEEFENATSNSKFEKTSEAYTFDKCEDLEVAHAILPDGATAHAYPAGTYDFESLLPADQKADAACTYTADIWKDWLKVTPDVAGTAEKGNVKWTTKLPVSGSGPHVIYFDRYKTCGDKKERIGFSCAKVHIE